MRVFEQATKFMKLAGIVLLLMVVSVATSWAQFTAPAVPPAPPGRDPLPAWTHFPSPVPDPTSTPVLRATRRPPGGWPSFVGS